MVRRILAITLLSASAAVAQTPARQQLPNDSLEIARKYVNWLYTSRFDSLLAHMTTGQQAMTITQMADSWSQIVARVGVEATLVEERWVRRGGDRQYWRIARFSDFADEPVAVRLVIMPDGQMGGLGVNPLSRVPPIDPEP